MKRRNWARKRSAPPPPLDPVLQRPRELMRESTLCTLSSSSSASIAAAPSSRGLALGLIRFPLRNSRVFVQAKITKKWGKGQGRQINKGRTRQGLGLGLDEGI